MLQRFAEGLSRGFPQRWCGLSWLSFVCDCLLLSLPVCGDETMMVSQGKIVVFSQRRSRKYRKKAESPPSLVARLTASCVSVSYRFRLSRPISIRSRNFGRGWHLITPTLKPTVPCWARRRTKSVCVMCFALPRRSSRPPGASKVCVRSVVRSPAKVVQPLVAKFCL